MESVKCNSGREVHGVRQGPGRSPACGDSNPDGSATSGFGNSFILNSTSASDVQAASGTSGQPLNSAYAPDGRYILPDSSGADFDNASRNKTFSTKLGTNPNGNSGDYTLFFADFASGFAGALTSWAVSLDATLTPVPEPITWALIVFGAIFGAVQLVRFYPRRLAAAG